MVLQWQSPQDGFPHPHLLRFRFRDFGDLSGVSGRFRRVLLPRQQRIRRGRHLRLPQMPGQAQRHLRVPVTQRNGAHHRAHR